MSTRPPSNDAADVAAWEEEKARLRDETEFRGEMREFAGDTKARLSALANTLEQHAKEDKERMDALEQRQGGIRSSIVKTDSKIAWIFGVGVGVTAVLGFALWLLERKP